MPPDGWFALLGTDKRVDTVRLLAWALLEKVSAEPPELTFSGRRMVGLFLWPGAQKEDGLVIAEDLDYFRRYIHQSEIDATPHPGAA